MCYYHGRAILLPPHQTPLGVPLDAHAVVMRLRRKTRRCDVLLSRAGHFAPPHQTPLGVPLDAHAVVMGLRWKTRRCDVLLSRAGHFAPPHQTPLGVPLDAHAVVMGLRWKTRRCDVLLSRAGHFAPPTKHPWEYLSRPMQYLWGSGGKRVGAMCCHRGLATLLPPLNTPGTLSQCSPGLVDTRRQRDTGYRGMGAYTMPLNYCGCIFLCRASSFPRIQYSDPMLYKKGTIFALNVDMINYEAIERWIANDCKKVK
ncbi:hypothetical protein B0H13DRAFT_69649 [Mycena leptocephala]|nr:hypothetical protein B0H13DRAFT_69649 [Mycena leptocephala]